MEAKIMNELFHAVHTEALWEKVSFVDERQESTSDLQSTSDCMLAKESPHEKIFQTFVKMSLAASLLSKEICKVPPMITRIYASCDGSQFHRNWVQVVGVLSSFVDDVKKLFNDANALKLNIVDDCEAMWKCKDLKSY